MTNPRMAPTSGPVIQGMVYDPPHGASWAECGTLAFASHPPFLGPCGQNGALSGSARAANHPSLNSVSVSPCNEFSPMGECGEIELSHHPNDLGKLRRVGVAEA